MAKPKRRKRTAEEYEKEIAEMAKRMRKRPESLKAARNSDAWLDFLDEIGVSVDNEAKEDFFEKVRQEVRPITPAYKPSLRREYQPTNFDRALIREEQYQRKATGRTQISYKDAETGRFISRADAENRLKNN